MFVVSNLFCWPASIFRQEGDGDLLLGEGDLLAEDVDVGAVQEFNVDVGLRAFYEATAANGKNLAYCVSPFDDALWSLF